MTYSSSSPTRLDHRMKIKHINFAVTYNCNSRCIHCNIWKRKPEGELTLAQIKQSLIQDPLLKSLESVGITGGEPFLRKDLIDICLSFSRAFPNVHIGVASHGMTGLKITERSLMIRDALPAGKFSMSISIDGLENEHDTVRGIPGAFEKTMQTVRALKAEGMNLCLSFTLTPSNFKSVMYVYELARETGVGFITRFAQNSPYYGNLEKNFTQDPSWVNEATSLLNSVIGRILETYDLQQNTIDPYIYFLIKAPEYTFMRKRLLPCYSGSHSLFIDSFGNVYPCIMLQEAIGNLLSESLTSLYHSTSASRIREDIAQKKCNCWTECETIRNLEAEQDVLRWNSREVLPRYGLEVVEKNGFLCATK
jgi:Fe-coproporphyrin III synthase